MAFNNIMQIATANLIDRLKQYPKVVEWGNQRFRYDPNVIDNVMKITNREIRKPVEYVWEFFEDLGFSDYLSIDVNEELKSIAMDLNFILKDKYDYNEKFDLVTNNGTGEHIFDQRTVFENMHNLCEVDGIMLNILPLSPWLNHGFYNYNPNLFRDIVSANRYEWCFLWIAQNIGNYIKVPHDLESWSFYENKKPKTPYSILEQAVEKLMTLNNTTNNISIVAAYKKKIDDKFIVPMQGRYVNDLNDDLKQEYSKTNLDTRQKNHTGANY